MQVVVQELRVVASLPTLLADDLIEAASSVSSMLLNPVIPEVMNMVCVQVICYHRTVAMGSEAVLWLRASFYGKNRS